jgi:hypothetical protein
MKYLSNYTEQGVSDTLNKYGAFFAFGTKQFEEQRQEGIKYVDLGAGLIAPKENASKVVDAIDEVVTSSIAKDIKENGAEKIIWREFANHECQIVGSPDDAIDALDKYNFSKEAISKEWGKYWNHCVDNDLF